MCCHGTKTCGGLILSLGKWHLLVFRYMICWSAHEHSPEHHGLAFLGKMPILSLVHSPGSFLGLIILMP